jgi:putative transposase
MDPVTHRKEVKHFDRQGDCHELTFSCYQRRPVLDSTPRYRLLSRGLDAAVRRLGFTLVAFVYMPEHVHLLVWAAEPNTCVDDLLFAIKRPTSFRIKQLLQAANDPLLRELTIQERPGKMTLRFWQEGPGYDRNIETIEEAWIAAEYNHNNPVRRGLCATPGEWKWSSWRFYHDPHSVPDPDLPHIDGFPPG